MKKYSIYLVLLAAWATSCTDMDESRNDLPLGTPSDYVVTGTIAGTSISARMTDVDSEDDLGLYTGSRTTFQVDDPILIGWSGNSTSYTYLYSGENGVFTPKTDTGTDNNYGLWKDLVGSNTTDVYAWYGQQETALPAIGSTISVQTDQSSENGYLKSLRLAAHASVTSGTCKELKFSFKHLMACFRIHLSIDDREVGSTDIIGSSASILGVKTTGIISAETTSNDYQLTAANGTTANIKMYRRPWSEQNPYWIDFKCLLPAQTLPKGQKITVTLANGKKYSCTLEGDVILRAGEVTSLSVQLVAKGGVSVFTPICTVIEAGSCAFSGNRIISAVQQSAGGQYYFYVYDKRPDGTWTAGEPVYANENPTAGDDLFKKDYKLSGNYIVPNMALYGDYAVVGYGVPAASSITGTYFIKKSTTTGRWFCAAERNDFDGYSVAISDKFMITGTHLHRGGASNPNNEGHNSWVYPIDENGNLGTGYKVTGMSGYKLSLSGNILATNNGVFQYDEGAEKWNKLYGAKHGEGQRVATDGKRVIIQADNDQDPRAHIYDLAGNEEVWSTDKPKAGVDIPVGIYDKYALAGSDNILNICYRNPNNENKWEIINSEGGFLEIMKRWNPTITIETIDGKKIIMKGTRAVIVFENKAYFIENIDKMVEDWINTPY